MCVRVLPRNNFKLFHILLFLRKFMNFDLSFMQNLAVEAISDFMQR
jgi:hypothetical protein